MSDVTLERLFRHMAWANNRLFNQLSELPEHVLNFSGWNPEWTVGKIANHIVIAQGRFLTRLQKVDPLLEHDFPLTSAGMKDLSEKALDNDQQLIKFLGFPDELLTFIRYGKEVSFMRSTVIGQIIHHATEHRAQIADIMAVNNMDVINLDESDLWSFERSERN